MTQPTKPQQTKATCPHCGSREFRVPYIERAWARLTGNDDGTVEYGDDGYCVEEHNPDYAEARCEECNKRVNLTGREIV